MAQAMLSPNQLTDTDEAILDMLAQGRVTAPYVADEIDKSLEYVRSRLRRFVEHEHVTKVHEGLYQLVDDPRGSITTNEFDSATRASNWLDDNVLAPIDGRAVDVRRIIIEVNDDD